MAEQGLDHPDVDSLLDQQRRGGVPDTKEIVRGRQALSAQVAIELVPIHSDVAAGLRVSEYHVLNVVALY